MSRDKLGACGAVLLLLLIGLMPMVEGEDREVTDGEAGYTVRANSHDAWKFTLEKGEIFVFDIKVVSGSEVDFYICVPLCYNDYTSDTASSFDHETSEIDSKSWDDKFGDDGTFYLIVDNDDTTLIGAEPTGAVRYSVDFEIRDKTLMERIVELLWKIVGVVLLIAYLVWRGKRRR